MRVLYDLGDEREYYELYSGLDAGSWMCRTGSGDPGQCLQAIRPSQLRRSGELPSESVSQIIITLLTQYCTVAGLHPAIR